MNAMQRARALAAIAAMAAGTAFAQTYTTPAPTYTVPTPTYTAPAAVTQPDGAVVPTVPPADMDTWANRYSLQHSGRISREAYLDEIARRWDAADINSTGLTPAELSRLTGRVDTNAPVPLSGTGVQPGNMGPGNSKGN